MRIGVLTGGGDVPGLNPCIKALVERAGALGWEVVGFRRGWAGPLYYDPGGAEGANAAWAERLTAASVRTIDRYGGTYLHTSRTNPSRVRPGDLPAGFQPAAGPAGKDGVVDCTARILEVLGHLGVDALVPIGGEDTLSYAAHLHGLGVPIVAVPKTMDNDVYGTDYCIGFSTAITRSVEAIHHLRTPAGSHERVAIVELFGRRSGETTLIASYLADVDRALISEVPFDVERLAGFVVEDRAANPSNYAVVAISEGAAMTGGAAVESGEADAYGHRKLGGIGDAVGAELKRLAGVEIISQRLAYLMRSGPPDSLDRMVAISYANLAVSQIETGRTGVMVALRNGVYTAVPADTCIQGVKRIDVGELYDADAYRPRVLRPMGKPMFVS